MVDTDMMDGPPLWQEFVGGPRPRSLSLSLVLDLELQSSSGLTHTKVYNLLL